MQEKISQISVLLNIDGKCYRFITICFDKKDGSYYIVQHIKDENSPVRVGQRIHLLSPNAKVKVDGLDHRLETEGHEIHFSIHPKRLYLKRKNKAGSSHLIEEYETQQYTDFGIRLHCIITSPPPLFMTPWTRVKPRTGEYVVEFEWDSGFCPQLSLYDLRHDAVQGDVEAFLQRQGRYEIISSNGLQPAIALAIKSTEGEIGTWSPIFSMFGKLVKKFTTTKTELQKVLDYNGISIDISSIPEDASITDFRMIEPEGD